MTLDPACPIVQGPMSGGGSTPALVAAVCEAGGIGSLGAAYLSPGQILAAAQAVRERTARPFAVNIFAGGDRGGSVDGSEAMLAILATHHEALDLQRPTLPAWPEDPFEAQFEAVLASGAAIFSFTFGLPHQAVVRAREAGLEVWGTATTVAEAVDIEAAGCTAVVAQGAEAGGHRGTFGCPFDQAMIGTLALVPQIADAVAIPVIAAGGIMDGRGIAAARALGAAGAQLGTAFLTCPEAGVPDAHKQAILAARQDQTRITRAFSGRPARGIANAFMDEAGDAALPYPLQNALTRPMRAEAARRGDASRLSLWAGQGVGLARTLPAAELVATLMREYRIARLTAPA